jgi:hydroxylaminobenzene mutase
LGYVESSKLTARQGLRLLQLGLALLLFTSFEGFAIPYFAVPNLGRSVHTLSGVRWRPVSGPGIVVAEA